MAFYILWGVLQSFVCYSWRTVLESEQPHFIWNMNIILKVKCQLFHSFPFFSTGFTWWYTVHFICLCVPQYTCGSDIQSECSNGYITFEPHMLVILSLLSVHNRREDRRRIIKCLSLSHKSTLISQRYHIYKFFLEKPKMSVPWFWQKYVNVCLYVCMFYWPFCRCV